MEKKFVLMAEPAQKWENNATFKQNLTLKLFIAFKMAYSCCFSLGVNLDFPEILQKRFYNINYWKAKIWNDDVVIAKSRNGY